MLKLWNLVIDNGESKGSLVLLCLLCSLHPAAAQFVELTAEIDLNEWSAPSREPVRTIHLVVGTNSWRMDGDLCSNRAMTYWFTGDSIIEHTKTLKVLQTDGVELSQEEINRFLGAERTTAYDCLNGNPSMPRGIADRMGLLERIGWLAFCSGPYLRRDHRVLFPPRDEWKELIPANAFSDLTTTFKDNFGLPKLIELYATNSPYVQPIVQYRVVSSTNILGWEFPLEFKMAQYLPAPLPGRPAFIVGTNGWELSFTARGKVTSIGPGTEPRIPPEILRAAGK